MAITYIDQPSSSKIEYLDKPEQSTWEAVKAALGSRQELRPYGEGDSVDTSDPFAMARETVTAPIRAGQTIAAAPDVVGEVMATEGGRAGFPKTAATAGTATSVLGPLLMGPAAEEKSILSPAVPAARQSAVDAAREVGIPLSRAEQTGSPFFSWLESQLEKTPLGSGPINDARATQMAAKEAALKKAGDEMGTSSDLYTSGQRAQAQIPLRRDAMNETRGKMFDAVPDNVHISPAESESVADTILREQADYLPTTRNADVIAIAKDIQNAQNGVSSGAGVTGGPEFRGVTRQAPDKVIPGQNIVTEHPADYNPAEPVVPGQGASHYTVDQIPERRIPGKPIYGGGASASPEESFAPKPNYQLLKRLRETLNGKIEDAKAAKNLSTLRDYKRLKVGVDKDIDSFVAGQSNPADSMVADEFKQSYGKANAFSGAFKRLHDSPEATALTEAAPEKVQGMVFQKNNETAIKQFRALAGEDGFNEVKKRFTQDLLESKNLKSELGKYEDGTLNAIYRPDELAKLNKLADATDLMKSAEKTAGNPSGTARNVVGAGSFGAAGYALKAGRPDVALSILGLPYLAAKELVGTANGIPLSSTVQRAIRGIGINRAAEAGKK